MNPIVQSSELIPGIQFRRSNALNFRGKSSLNGLSIKLVEQGCEFYSGKGFNHQISRNNYLIGFGNLEMDVGIPKYQATLGLCIDISSKRIEDAFTQLNLANETRSYFMEFLSLPKALSSDDLTFCLQKLMKEQTSATDWENWLLEFITQHIGLIQKIQHLGMKRDSSAISHCSGLEFVRKSILKNIQENYSLNDLESLSGISKFNLIRLCKRLYGESPMKWVTRIKMEEAARRISQGTPIFELAEEMNFSDLSQFNKSFKRIWHVPPSQFKKSILDK